MTTALHKFFFFQAEDGIRDFHVTGVQTCALPISGADRASTEGAPDRFGSGCSRGWLGDDVGTGYGGRTDSRGHLQRLQSCGLARGLTAIHAELRAGVVVTAAVGASGHGGGCSTGGTSYGLAIYSAN